METIPQHFADLKTLQALQHECESRARGRRKRSQHLVAAERAQALGRIAAALQQAIDDGAVGMKFTTSDFLARKPGGPRR